jgi:hypothetical protein
MIYQFRTGYSLPVKPQVVGDRLTEIKSRSGDTYSAQDVVDDARPEGTPLHPCFEWDDAEAADKWRLEQARCVIRSIEPVESDQKTERGGTVYFVSVGDSKKGSAYTTIKEAMQNVGWAAQVKEEARSMLAAWHRRYADILKADKEFAPAIAEIGPLVEEPKPDEPQKVSHAKETADRRKAKQERKRKPDRRSPQVAAGQAR